MSKTTTLHLAIEVTQPGPAPMDQDALLRWIWQCLNCNTNHAQAGVSLLTPSPAGAEGPQPKRHFILSGRVCGDEEDTVLPCQADTHADACDQFKAALRDGTRVSDEEWEQMDADGRIFINSVFCSAAPICESSPTV